ncbi:PepSY-associated TM helix domain-containing protein [bacterium]|nr:PepSY-associated TM helix domain-containing protein [bacterium]
MENRKSNLALYKLNRSLHRDVGYLTVGFTLIFAISGIAVNHIQDWNPNYSVSRVEYKIPAVDVRGQDEMVAHVLKHVSLTAPVKSSFRSSPYELKIFFDGSTLTYNIQTGVIIEEQIQERDVLFDMNYLHLNHAKKIWTWVSDVFAVFLIFLSISGLFILKGKQGIKGRGAILTLIGFAIPIAFLLLYRYF